MLHLSAEPSVHVEHARVVRPRVRDFADALHNGLLVHFLISMMVSLFITLSRHAHETFRSLLETRKRK